MDCHMLHSVQSAEDRWFMDVESKGPYGHVLGLTLL
jgi:hypothetical protein